MSFSKTTFGSIKAACLSFRSESILSIYAVLSITYLYLIIANRSVIVSIQDHSLEFLGILFVSTGIFLFIGTRDKKKYNQKLNLISNIVGIFFCLLLLLNISDQLGIFLYAFFGGLSAGLCLPNLLTAFLERTNFNNRGSISGIFLFITYILIFVLSSIISDLYSFVAVLMAIKIVSIIFSFKISVKTNEIDSPFFVKQGKRIKFSFLITFAVFILANTISTALLVGKYQDQASTISMYSSLIGLFSIILGGALMDQLGRRKMMLFAFTYLGLSYGLISLTAFGFYQLSALDGIAWGILTVLFLMVLWGDLCSPADRSVWISFSLLIALSNTLISRLFIIYSPVLNIKISAEQLFPLTSILLFLAVGIILYLPETLPDKILKKKELEDYITQAKKVREKYKKRDL